jgi:hypothetical protein
MSGNVPFTALTSNQFIEGMKKIFELEPFIKLHSAHDVKVSHMEENALKAI